MTIPASHPQRRQLNEELHARPPEALLPPERVSHLALYSDRAAAERERQALADLCARFGHTQAPPTDNHARIDLGTVRLKWQKHTEFTAYTFFLRGPFQDPFASTAIESVPQDWLSGLPGRTLMAAHLAIYPVPETPRSPEELAVLFDGQVLTGARIGDGAGLAYADFHPHADGFSRFLARTSTSRRARRAAWCSGCSRSQPI
jgi:uncharacterized membrane-anchored protein